MLKVESQTFIYAARAPRLQVCAVRNLYVEKGFNPTHFLSHAAFDCGSLEH